MPIGDWLGPAIGATGALAASGASNLGSRRAMRRANKQNIGFWNMQNEYNTPSAQMQRLRDAGLNPNLIYGTGAASTGNAEKIAPSKAEPFNIDNPIHSIGQFADLEKTETTSDNLRATNDVLQQEVVLKGAQAADLGIKTSKNKFDLGLATELRDTSLQAAQLNIKQMEANILTRDLDNEITEQSTKAIIKDLYYRGENAAEIHTGQQLTNNLRQLEVELKRIGIERNDPWYFRIIGRHLKEVNTIIQQSAKNKFKF